MVDIQCKFKNMVYLISLKKNNWIMERIRSRRFRCIFTVAFLLFLANAEGVFPKNAGQSLTFI